MFEIDPTSAVLFAALSVTIALVICVALRRHRRGDAAIRWLMGSNTALFSAAIGVLLQPVIGFAVASMLVIAGAYLGIVCAFFAVLRAEGRALPWRLLGGIGVVGLTVQGALAARVDSHVPLMLTSSVLNSALTVYMIVRVWQVMRGYGSRMASLLCLPFAALFLGYFGRLIALGLAPDSDWPVTISLLIIVAMAWAAVILELAMIALREAQARVRLRDALERVEAAYAARTRFLLGISHDLRTPLNAILGLSELMRAQIGGPLPDGHLERAVAIQTAGQQLYELISDLLVHAAEQDGTGLEMPSPIDVDDAVRSKFALVPDEGRAA